MKKGRVLVVAGSDPIAGAGLQADIRVITALGGYAMTAVTAITVQDSRQVMAVHPVDADLLTHQMQTCLEDVGADVIKIGMLATSENVAAVADLLAHHPDIPVVADPVLAGTGGGTLLDQTGLDYFKEKLLRRVTLLTPNLSEAARLTGTAVTTPRQMEQAARALGNHAASVLVTGGHLPTDRIEDLWYDGHTMQWFSDERHEFPEGVHGTGCALASAVAAGLARGMPPGLAVATGLGYARWAIGASEKLGTGQRLMRHGGGTGGGDGP